MRIGEERNRAARRARDAAEVEGVVSGIIAMREPFGVIDNRSEEHTSELQSLMRISYAVFCLKKKTTSKISDKLKKNNNRNTTQKAETCIHKEITDITTKPFTIT